MVAARVSTAVLTVQQSSSVATPPCRAWRSGRCSSRAQRLGIQPPGDRPAGARRCWTS